MWTLAPKVCFPSTQSDLWGSSTAYHTPVLSFHHVNNQLLLTACVGRGHQPLPALCPAIVSFLLTAYPSARGVLPLLGPPVLLPIQAQRCPHISGGSFLSKTTPGKVALPVTVTLPVYFWVAFTVICILFYMFHLLLACTLWWKQRPFRLISIPRPQWFTVFVQISYFRGERAVWSASHWLSTAVPLRPCSMPFKEVGKKGEASFLFNTGKTREDPTDLKFSPVLDNCLFKTTGTFILLTHECFYFCETKSTRTKIRIFW